MGHDWVDLALGLLVSAIGGLTYRFFNRVDALEERAAEHSEEIRDTRQAVSRIEGSLDLSPFPYKN